MNPENLIEFFEEVGKLKKIKRMGWVLRGVENPESVAEHSFRVTLISSFASEFFEEKLDREKIFQMALLHEIAEVKLGDLTLVSKRLLGEELVSKTEERIAKELLPLEKFEIFKEFEDGKTLEAKIVRASDKFEMFLQAFELEKRQKMNLEEFWREEQNLEEIKELEFFKDLFELLSLKREINLKNFQNL
ncbi:MAG: HD family hydrolase [Candidatus Methanofastidiosia archaeon]